MNYDVFICHASEDKLNVVRPLVEALHSNDILCWVDELEISWGDSVSGKINQGLEKSRHVIVVISTSFLQKNWPKKELESAFSQEMADGSTRVLPLFVGDREALVIKLPLLSDKRSLEWSGDPGPIIKELKKLLGRPSSRVSATSPVSTIMPKLPSVPKTITDLDRDRFLQSAFDVVLKYFQTGVEQINQSDQQLHVELDKQTSSSFSCQIYVSGNKKSFCQIWIGSDYGPRSHIYYSTTPKAIGGTGRSFNEMISIDESSDELRLKETMGNMMGKRNEGSTAQTIAESLWERFVK